MMVRIAGVMGESITDGPGFRTTVFFQGCPHACPGCHNPHTWREAGGTALSIDELIGRLPLTPLISGVTFSGGEPFAQAEAAAQIARAVRASGLGLWVYTGYVWEQLLASSAAPGVAALLALADVVVDGPYLRAQRDLGLAYRGSRNQRLILAAPSLAQGRVVEWGSAAP